MNPSHLRPLCGWEARSGWELVLGCWRREIQALQARVRIEYENAEQRVGSNIRVRLIGGIRLIQGGGGRWWDKPMTMRMVARLPAFRVVVERLRTEERAFWRTWNSICKKEIYFVHKETRETLGPRLFTTVWFIVWCIILLFWSEFAFEYAVFVIMFDF